MTQEKKGNLRNEHCKEDTYISKGFRSWKKASKCFNDHQGSGCHKIALTNHVTIPKCGDIVEMTNTNVQKSRNEERRYFIKVMECVQYLGRQGLAFQGESCDGNDNFTQLMKLRGKDDRKIIERLSADRKGKRKYIHADYQNELNDHGQPSCNEQIVSDKGKKVFFHYV